MVWISFEGEGAGNLCTTSLYKIGLLGCGEFVWWRRALSSHFKSKPDWLPIFSILLFKPGGRLVVFLVTIGLKFFYSFFFFFCLYSFSRAAPMACGGSQARGLIKAVATGLHQSHSNSESKPHLRPTSQLTATPDP